jgi:xanthine dehydrogenase YagT iron-sulfur-binding subunit
MSDPPKVAAPLKFARRMPITIRVNGSDVASEVPARTTLLDWLRETVG